MKEVFEKLINSLEKYNKKEFQQILTENSFLLYEKNNEQKTILYLAIELGNIEATSFLLQQLKQVGRDIKYKINNKFPLELAIEKNNIEIVKLLIDPSNHVNEKTDINFNISKSTNPDEKKTYLELAINLGFIDIAEILIESKEIKIDKKNNKKQTFLHLAIEKGRTTLIETLLAKGININIQDYQGKTPLHLAIEKGDATLIETLLAKNVKLDSQDSQGKTPLHLAIEKGNATLIEKLLARDIKLDIQDNQGKTPLHLDIQDNQGKTPLHLAIEKEDATLIEKLLAKNVKLDIQDNQGKTPLHLAVKKGNLELIKILLKKDLQLDIQDNQGKTPLHLAVKKGNLELIKILLEKRAKSNIQNIKKETSFKLAISSNNPEMIKLFIENEANLKEINLEVLHKFIKNAVKNQPIWTEIAKLLITKFREQNIDINKPTEKTKITSLYLAIEAENIEFVDILVEDLKAKKISIDIQNSQFLKDALELAIKKDNKEIIEKLLTIEDIVKNIQDKQVTTPLHLAVEKGNLELIKILLEKGAKSDIENNKGETPFKLAISSNNPEMIKLFIEIGTNSREINLTLLHKFIENAAEDQLPIWTKIVKLLIIKLKEQNIDIHKPTEKTKITSLYLAIELGNIEFVDILIEDLKTINIGNSQFLKDALELAIKKDNKEIIEKLLTIEGIVKNIQDKQVTTPLHLAVEKEDPTLIEKLLTNGINIDIQDENGKTPLHLAVETGNLELIKILLEKGAKSDIENNKGETPFKLAISSNNPEMIKLFIEIGTNSREINLTLLHKFIKNAVKNQPIWTEIVKLVIIKLKEQNIDIHKQHKKTKETSLYLAVEAENIEFVEILVKDLTKIDIKIKEKLNNVLKLAIIRGNKEIVNLLLNNGADPNYSKNGSKTPLYNAAYYNHKEILEILIVNGANKNKKYIQGNLLYIALLKKTSKKPGSEILSKEEKEKYLAEKNQKRLETVKFLIEEKLDIKAKNKFNKTLLHQAIFCDNNLEIITLFFNNLKEEEKLEYINAPDNQGNTALYLVFNNKTPIANKTKLVKLLVENGANPNTLNILEQAIILGNPKILDFLVKNGVDIRFHKQEILKKDQGFGQDSYAKYFLKFADERVGKRKEYPELVQILEKMISDTAKLEPLPEEAQDQPEENIINDDIDKDSEENMTNDDIDENSRQNQELLLQLIEKESNETAIRELLKKDIKLIYDTMDEGRNNLLHLAILHKNISYIKLLVELLNQYEEPAEFKTFPKTIINNENANQKTPLQLATEQGDLEVLQLLITVKGINLGITNSEGQNLLHLAALFGHGELISFFIQNGIIDISVPDKNGKTPSDYAINKGYANIAKILQDNAHIKKTQIKLCKLIQNNKEDSLEEVKKLSESYPMILQAQDKTGKNVLVIIAILYENAEIINFLMKQKININWSYYLDDALLASSVRDVTKIIELLVDNIIDITKKYKGNRTYLHILCLQGGIHGEQKNNILNIFLEAFNKAGKNEEINSYDDQGHTPLYYAVKYRQSDKIIESLIDNGAIIDLAGANSKTPLSICQDDKMKNLLLEFTEKRHRKILKELGTYTKEQLKELLEKDVRFLRVYDDNLDTPMHIAVKEKRQDLVEILVKYLEKEEKLINEELTPYKHAYNLSKKSIFSIQGLLYSIVNTRMLNHTNKNEQNPLHIAIETNQPDIAIILAENWAGCQLETDKTLLDYANANNTQLIEHLSLIIKHKQQLHRLVYKSVLSKDGGEEEKHNVKEDIMKLLTNHPILVRITGDAKRLLDYASETNDINMVSFLIDNKISRYDHVGNPSWHGILHHKSSIEIIEFLLKLPELDINAIDAESYNALHITSDLISSPLFVATTKLLLERGANINQVSYYNETPLNVAYRKKNEEIVKLLRDAISEKYRPILDQMKKQRYINSKEIETLSKTCPNFMEVTDEDGNNFLHIAVKNGRQDITDFLLKFLENYANQAYYAGYDSQGSLGYAKDVAYSIINKINNQGETPLKLAIQGKNTKIVKSLKIVIGNLTNENIIKEKRKLLIELIEKDLKSEIEQLFEDYPNLFPTNVQITNDYPLHIAVQRKNADIVEILLNNDIDPTININATTSLHLATKNEDKEIVRLLINALKNLKKLDHVNNRDKENKTPLYYAVSNKNREIIKILLDNGADPTIDIDLTTKKTLLHLAAENGNPEIVGLLIDSLKKLKKLDYINNEDKDNKTPLDYAISHKKLDIAKIFLNADPDINIISKSLSKSLYNIIVLKQNIPDLKLVIELFNSLNLSEKLKNIINRPNLGNKTLLYYAVSRKNTEIVKILLDNGADSTIDIDDNNKTILLHLATENGNPEIVGLLIDSLKKLKKLNYVNNKDKNNKTCLYYAVLYGNIVISKILLDNGANPTIDIDPIDGKTLLHLAVRNGKTEIVGLLIDSLKKLNQIDYINRIDKFGHTSLYYAVSDGNMEIAKTLLDNGADPTINIDPTTKKTLLHLATENNNVAIVKLLINSLKDPKKLNYVNQVDKYGHTSLYYAVSSKKEDVIKILLDNGADPTIDIDPIDKRTLLHLAMTPFNTEIVRVLIDSLKKLKKIDYVNQVDRDGKTPLYYALLSTWSADIERAKLLAEVSDIENLKNTLELLKNIDIKKEMRELVMQEINKNDNKTASAAAPLVPNAGSTIITQNNSSPAQKAFSEAEDRIKKIMELSIALININEINTLLTNYPILIKTIGGKANDNFLHHMIKIGMMRHNIEGIINIINKSDSTLIADIINIPDNNGETILHTAAANLNNYKLIKCLIINGADVTKSNKKAQLPSDVLVAMPYDNEVQGEKYSKILSMFSIIYNNRITSQNLPNEMKLLQTGLIKLIEENGDLAEIENLLKSNRDLINTTDKLSNSLLHIAIQKKNTNIVKVLMKYNPNLYIRNIDNNFPLKLALNAGEDIFKILLTSMENMNEQERTKIINISQDLNQNTLLHLAVVKEGFEDTVRILIKYGANINSYNHYVFPDNSQGGETPFEAFMLSNKDNIELTRLFIENGLELNNYPLFKNVMISANDNCANNFVILFKEKNEKLLVDFMTAIIKDCPYILSDSINAEEFKKAKILIENGAAVNSANDLYLALKANAEIEIIDLLVKKGADVTRRCSEGNNILHILIHFYVDASTSDQKEKIHKNIKYFIKLFQERGLNINAENLHKETILTIAKKHNCKAIIEEIPEDTSLSNNNRNNSGNTPSGKTNSTNSGVINSANSGKTNSTNSGKTDSKAVPPSSKKKFALIIAGIIGFFALIFGAIYAYNSKIVKNLFNSFFKKGANTGQVDRNFTPNSSSSINKNNFRNLS